MTLKIGFVAFVLAVAAGIGGVTIRTIPVAASSGNACVYEPERIEPCTTCS
jgi:hypothetical protein